MLLSALMDLAPVHGVETVYLEVRKSNKAARMLYESEGFVKTGERRDYYADPIEDAVMMEIKLKEER